MDVAKCIQLMIKQMEEEHETAEWVFTNIPGL